jgi:hypothetical protein
MGGDHYLLAEIQHTSRPARYCTPAIAPNPGFVHVWDEQALRSKTIFPCVGFTCGTAHGN